MNIIEIGFHKNATGQLDINNLSLRLSFQVILHCVKLTVKTNNHNQGMVVHALNPRILKTEAGGYLLSSEPAWFT